MEADEGSGEVNYDLAAWTDVEREQLADTLQLAGLDFRWEGTDLVVAVTAEEYMNLLVGLDDGSDDHGSEDGDVESAKATGSDHAGGILGNIAEVVIDGIGQTLIS